MSFEIKCVDNELDGAFIDVIERCQQSANEGKDYLLYQGNAAIYSQLKDKLIEYGFAVSDLGNRLHEGLEFIKKFYNDERDIYVLGCNVNNIQPNYSAPIIYQFAHEFNKDNNLMMKISGWTNGVLAYQPSNSLFGLFQLYEQNKNIVFDGIVYGCKLISAELRDNFGFYKIGYDDERLRKWINENGFDVYVEDSCDIAIRGWYYYHPSKEQNILLQELQDIYHKAEIEMYVERLPQKFKLMAKSGYIDQCELVGSKIAPKIVSKLKDLGYRSWIWDQQYILTDWSYETNPKFGYRTQNTYTGEMAEWNKVTDELLNQWKNQPLSNAEKELRQSVMDFESNNNEKLIKLIQEIKNDIDKFGYFQGCPSGDYAMGMNRLLLNYFLDQSEFTVSKYRTYADFLSYTHGIEIKRKN